MGLMLASGSVLAQSKSSYYRQWKTIDDETNKPKSVVQIYERNGKMYGKIIKLFRTPDQDQNHKCKECDEDEPRYMKPIIGMEIITDMECDSGDKEWEDGEIIDPASGSTYESAVWIDVDTGNLKVRGYKYFFYRTQTWLPYNGN